MNFNDESSESISPMEPSKPAHGKFSRAIGAIICGLLAGFFLSNAIGASLSLRFPNENPNETWRLLWGEHWVLRIAASLISACWAGFITGLVNRQRGPFLATIVVIPSAICWLVILITGVTGQIPFLHDETGIHISLGNKIAAAIILLGMIPSARYGANEGEAMGELLGQHFDSRKHTLLGIKWYHHLWLPFLMQFAAIEIAWAGFYLAIWIKALWQSGFSWIGMIVPMIFTYALYGIIAFIGTGLLKSYNLLSGLEDNRAKGIALDVLKHGVGKPLLALLMLVAIEFLQYGLVKLRDGWTH